MFKYILHTKENLHYNVCYNACRVETIFSHWILCEVCESVLDTGHVSMGHCLPVIVSGAREENAEIPGVSRNA